MFWSKFVELCNINKTTPNAVAKQIGISSASVTYWKNGSHPRDTAIKKLTQYFGVESDYFEKGHNTPSPNPDYTYAAYDELTKELNPEQIKQLVDFANFLRQQNK